MGKTWHWEAVEKVTLAGTTSPIWTRVDNKSGKYVYEDGSLMPDYLQG